jgi:hypothetical protein
MRVKIDIKQRLGGKERWDCLFKGPNSFICFVEIVVHLVNRAVRVAQWKVQCWSPLRSQDLVRPVLHVIERVTLFDSIGFLHEVPGLNPGQTCSSCDREGDSLWQRRFSPGLRFPPTLYYKSPNIVQVDSLFSIQYFLRNLYSSLGVLSNLYLEYCVLELKRFMYDNVLYHMNLSFQDHQMTETKLLKEVTELMEKNSTLENKASTCIDIFLNHFLTRTN